MNYTANLAKTLLLTAAIEFRKSTFQGRYFLEPLLRVYEETCAAAGEVYEWMTQEDRESRDRLEKRLGFNHLPF